MNRYYRGVLACLIVMLFIGQIALSATFSTSSAELAVGEKVSSKSAKNGNTTVFIFSEIITSPQSKKKAAFLQWAPLVPRASKYRNGSLVDVGTSLRLWINGTWYVVSFNGKIIQIH